MSELCGPRTAAVKGGGRGAPDSPLALPGKEVDRTKSHPSQVVCSHPQVSATLEEVDDQKSVNSGSSNHPLPLS